MEAPEAFLEKLKLVDPLLYPQWNIRESRWEILRRNPRSPNLPPIFVRRVEEPGGGFRPLDNRTINWLYKADVTRRFRHHRPDQYGRLLEEEAQREQDAMDAEKERISSEMWNDVMDRAKFRFRRLERKGLLGS